jgi:hypothetical protein
MDENRLAEILAEKVTLRQVEPGIYSVLAPAEASVSYDNVFGTFYDRVACSRLYNRLVWGYSTAEYRTLCPMHSNRRPKGGCWMTVADL